jgi:hypothetical protein
VGSPLPESFGFLGLSMVCYLVELDSYLVYVGWHVERYAIWNC